VAAATGTDANANKSREIISSIERQTISGSTSALTFDEVVFIVRKIAGFEKSLIAGENFLNISRLKIIEVNYQSILLAHELMKKFRIKPRDAIHTACAINNDVKTIISDDSDFDAVKEIERINIKDFKV